MLNTEEQWSKRGPPTIFLTQKVQSSKRGPQIIFETQRSTGQIEDHQQYFKHKGAEVKQSSTNNISSTQEQRSYRGPQIICLPQSKGAIEGHQQQFNTEKRLNKRPPITYQRGSLPQKVTSNIFLSQSKFAIDSQQRYFYHREKVPQRTTNNIQNIEQMCYNRPLKMYATVQKCHRGPATIFLPQSKCAIVGHKQYVYHRAKVPQRATNNIFTIEEQICHRMPSTIFLPQIKCAIEGH